MKKKILVVGFLFLGVFLLSFYKLNPKVFVIGDSISIFYGPYLKKCLEKDFVYDRKRDKGEAMKDLDNPIGANGGDSNMVLAYLNELAADSSFYTDIFLINCGLHDIKIDRKTGKRAVSLDKYRENVLAIYQCIKDMGARMIWINSTPVNDTIHNSKNVGFYRYNQDVCEYNRVADSILVSKEVPIIDLYSFSLTFPLDAYMDHVHYKDEYRDRQAKFISDFLKNISKIDVCVN